MKTNIAHRATAILDVAAVSTRAGLPLVTIADAAMLSNEYKGVLRDTDGKIVWRCAHQHHKREVATHCAAGERKAAIIARHETERRDASGQR